MSKTANLRTCACCEWIFTMDKQHPTMGGCPQCGFGHYGARHVYGNKAYQYARTQRPWLDKKMAAHADKLQAESRKTALATKSTRALALI